jgi:hypothetical protein
MKNELINYKKALFLPLVTFIFCSCQSNEDEKFEILKNNVSKLNALISLVENQYKAEFNNRQGKNRIVFSHIENKGFENDDFIYDRKVIDEMDVLNIQEIRFENVESNCDGNHGFTEIYFVLKNESFNESISYLFEYCGARKEYSSATISYKPLNDNWGLYVESD